MVTQNVVNKKANMSMLVFLPTICMLCAFVGVVFFGVSSQSSGSFLDCSAYEGNAYESCVQSNQDTLNAQNNALMYGVPLCCVSTILVGIASTVAFFVMRKSNKPNQENSESANTP